MPSSHHFERWELVLFLDFRAALDHAIHRNLDVIPWPPQCVLAAELTAARIPADHNAANIRAGRSIKRLSDPHTTHFKAS